MDVKIGMQLIKSLFTFAEKSLIAELPAVQNSLQPGCIHLQEEKEPPEIVGHQENYPPGNMELPVFEEGLNVSHKEFLENKGLSKNENSNGQLTAGLIRCSRKRQSRDQLLTGTKKLALTASENAYQNLGHAKSIALKVLDLSFVIYCIPVF
jgi:hypothetical protein